MDEKPDGTSQPVYGFKTNVTKRKPFKGNKAFTLIWQIRGKC